MMERPAWQRALYEIWPKVHRTITGIVFFVLMVLKSSVRIALDQIKRM